MRDSKTPWLLLLPTIIYLVIFFAYPIFETFVLAFSNPEGALGNYVKLFHSKMFWKSLTNTLFFAITIIPIQLAFALGLALFVNKKAKGHMLLLYLITIPLALSDISAALMSYTIFTPMGYLNKILLKFGFIDQPIYFFGFAFKSREFWIIVLTEVWRATPLVFIIILAGLQGINREYIEAAEVFGFTPWQRFTKIILPLLKPSIMSALLIRTLFAFQIFGVVWLLAGRDIPILAGETFYWYTQRNNPNMSSAYALIITVITFIISWVYLTTLRAEHLEEGMRA